MCSDYYNRRTIITIHSLTMYAILIISFTLSGCFSALRDCAQIQDLLVKTADFLTPEDIVRLQRVERLTQEQLNEVRFAPSPMMLTASNDLTVKLWNAETGELIRSFEGHNHAVRFAVFSSLITRI